jgi:hypothetical protein
MLISPTSVAAVSIHALLPVSSQLGTAQLGDAIPAEQGKLFWFEGTGTICPCANAGCALSTIIRSIRAIAAIA